MAKSRRRGRRSRNALLNRDERQQKKGGRTKITMAAYAGVMLAAVALAGCVTTGNPMSDEEALANYPTTGIEAITGHWGGTWTQGTSYSTLRVTAQDADNIEVRYCYGGWCAGGCSDGTCSSHGNKLRSVRFEDGELKFKVKTAKVMFTRKGAGLHGDFNGKYTSNMKRQRE